jgi:hypothetical protein
VGSPVSTFEPEDHSLDPAKVAFHEEAQKQRICRRPGCRSNWPWHPHHVVYRQELEKLGIDDMAILWDPRNCIRLCPTCHANQHGLHHLPLTCLRDANYEFAFEHLGERAGSYLRAKYDGDDPRLDEWERDWRERIRG